MDDEQLPRPEPENPRPQQHVPAFNLPPAILASLAVLIVIFAVMNLPSWSDDTLNWIYFTFSFIPARYAFPLSQQGLEWLWTPVTYSLLHGGIEHIVFNSLWLMVFAAPVARRIGALRYVNFWIFSSAASAFLHAALYWGDQTLLIGASGVVSALMGAACRFAFPAMDGRRVSMRQAHLNPRLSILESLRSRTVVAYIVMWVAGNALVAFGINLAGDSSQPVAWDAHIGGFLFGFLLFAPFDRQPPVEAQEALPLDE
ncbi:membrane associated rhomboid family serine protease [Rhizobium sp. ERR 922]|uniref:rhomboid family intramembrane serine protease n=1 Tax=unclassified Rhizobium TaxID=2613769 RepID=UPI0011A1A7CB|nr:MULTISPECIES: rhomboid family intramembrane serine protease [unclassified Rhizobium]TWB62007.1 membrane associated rhomboid family serine protease [Rhizobium sp. ERR 922]TWC04933.1 membrane associated rhomboid family serine protease [Rhizobium sp. ERR 942]